MAQARTGSFTTRDGVDIRYTHHGAGHRAAIVVAPGIFMHRDSPEHQAVAARLLAVADVVTLDLRGHGDSGGSFSWGAQEPLDVADLAATLRPAYRRVGGLGFSFGGYHVAVAAALHRPFDAVAIVAAPRSLFILDHNFLTSGLKRSLPLMLRRRRRLTRVSLRPPYGRPAPASLVDQIAPVPLLIAHGTADWLIPPTHGRTLYDNAREPKRLLLVEGGLHAEYMLAEDAEALLGPVAAFFAEHL